MDGLPQHNGRFYAALPAGLGEGTRSGHLLAGRCLEDRPSVRSHSAQLLPGGGSASPTWLLAVLLVAGATTANWLPVIQLDHIDRTPSRHWPEPNLVVDPSRDRRRGRRAGRLLGGPNARG